MRKIAGFLKITVFILLSTSVLSSCFLIKKKGGEVSSTTGMAYGNSKDTLSFTPFDTKNLPNPPGMVYVQGGRTVLGSFEEDLFGTRDNIERTVTVNSFYMDETEITNQDWKEYVKYQFNPMVVGIGRDLTISDDPNNAFVPATKSHHGL
uniref:formylglycine-generating enzyme family protein n=1 Tax=Roseivirga sp. TaxID=1964215 RepID=UPI004047601B